MSIIDATVYILYKAISSLYISDPVQLYNPVEMCIVLCYYNYILCILIFILWFHLIASFALPDLDILFKYFYSYFERRI